MVIYSRLLDDKLNLSESDNSNDGKGYPSRLKGEKIHYLARILTVIDSFDAITSNKPYNKRKNYEEGIKS